MSKYPFVYLLRKEKYSHIDSFFSENIEKLNCTIEIISPEQINKLKNMFNVNYHLLVTYGDSEEEYIGLVWKEIVKEGIVAKNPTDDVKIPKPIHKIREYLTKDEIQMLIDTPLKQNNLKQFFLLSCFTGLRHSDVKRLTWKNLVIENDRHYFNIVIAKTKEPLVIPLNKDAVKLMGEPEGDDDKIIKGLSYSAWANQLIEKWGYVAGLKKKITPHTARHTFATQFISQTKDWKSLQYILGHSDLKTTQAYAKLIKSDVEESIDKMKDLL